MRSFLSILCLTLLFWGCGENQTSSLEDLKRPQDAMIYAQEMEEFQTPEILQELKNTYLKEFFAPFSGMVANPNTQEVFWIQGSLQKYPGYGENLEANTLEYTQGILQNMQIKKYPSASQMALVIKDTNVRAVPTMRPRFSKPNGYPFDRWQNSLIFYGTPVLITHYDVSGRYAHIQTNFVYGWVEVADLALVSKTQAKELLNIKTFVMPNNDTQSIKDKEGRYLTQMRVGKLFMLDDKKQMLLFQRTSSGNLKISKTTADLSDFHSFPQAFSQKAVAYYINLLVGQKYGWGGMYESRDCSAFIRDIFGNFGLYLPRNSYAQAQYGNHQIGLDSLKLPQKESMILQNAIPFATILWLKGHIMLYIGKDQEGRAMVAHSGWSVQSSNLWEKKEHKLGGVVITTLTPAEEYNGILFGSPSLGDRVRIMNQLLPYLKGQIP
ncbi:SH3 domain-containing protein [Helicobacter kayseriensis]|uniref:C40 family peptidase n=1 Tax=Helicobacter kayseriensis TaxID=2905877 RepID=UPI001E300F17|nr:SH3 domain-containing C40 family peptidase [Helicobacter kayseriensis]MCE3046845.1 SH3 domain-containing protein [Helicobacter kayseriensis]MCE3047853.1 SH3 domain-containing protein [Helicobacter kayseriensis]